MKVFVFAVGLALFLLPACKTSCRSIQKKSPESVFISLERTACFGTCPVDQYTLYVNGHQRYEGRMFTEKKGEHLADIGEKEACEWFKGYEKLPWQQWDSIYPTLYSDLPSFIVRYQFGKVKKEITVSGECPEELKLLIDGLISQSEGQHWRPSEVK